MLKTDVTYKLNTDAEITDALKDYDTRKTDEVKGPDPLDYGIAPVGVTAKAYRRQNEAAGPLGKYAVEFTGFQKPLESVESTVGRDINKNLEAQREQLLGQGIGMVEQKHAEEMEDERLQAQIDIAKMGASATKSAATKGLIGSVIVGGAILF